MRFISCVILPLLWSQAISAELLYPEDSSYVQMVKDRYIVVLKRKDTAILENLISSIGVKPDFKYLHSIVGFTASLTEAQLEQLDQNPQVDFFEQDSETSTQPVNTGEHTKRFNRDFIKEKRRSYSFIGRNKKNIATQKRAPWGLARISNRRRRHTKYTYDKSAGSGTCVYILDSGIEINHPEFEGRAKFLKNFSGGSDGDNDGLGTHHAGIIGSKTYGVAKNTTLYSVKITDTGTVRASTLIAALDFLSHERFFSSECPNGSVIHISESIDYSPTLNIAVSKAGWGFTVVNAAGNWASNIGSDSPSSAESACTVGATDRDDKFADYSNYGKHVNILAPGSDVLSTWIGAGTRSLTGTQMASSHVAGLSAYFLGRGVAWVAVCEMMVDRGTKNAIDKKSFPSYRRVKNEVTKQNKKFTSKEIYDAGKSYYEYMDPPNVLAYNGF
ncbi:hypothetical protein QQS21_000650 [Conoideocrella luteorostrata]|uniref:Uncharacterized protein n=1 Tax=Conoideocrella luteorostrata TaxID=1105319 RepID=A0AAJ0CYH3_9HYPO|nr:hypothetical protein QQS21_000650 [Conoideocrella luteorostrata]